MNYVLYIDPLQALTTVVIAIASGLRYKKGGGGGRVCAVGQGGWS
jgi:hypothetical protein